MEASSPTLNMQQRSLSEPYLSNFNGGRSGLGMGNTEQYLLVEAYNRLSQTTFGRYAGRKPFRKGVLNP